MDTLSEICDDINAGADTPTVKQEVIEFMKKIQARIISQI